MLKEMKEQVHKSWGERHRGRCWAAPARLPEREEGRRD